MNVSLPLFITSLKAFIFTICQADVEKSTPPILVWGVSESINHSILWSSIKWNIIFGGTVIFIDFISLMLISKSLKTNGKKESEKKGS